MERRLRAIVLRAEAHGGGRGRPVGAAVQHQGLLDPAQTQPEPTRKVDIHRRRQPWPGGNREQIRRRGRPVGGRCRREPSGAVVQEDREAYGFAAGKGFAKRDHVAQRHDPGGRVEEIGGRGAAGVCGGQSAERGERERLASVYRRPVAKAGQQQPPSRAGRGGCGDAAHGHHGDVPADDGPGQETQGLGGQTRRSGPASSYVP